MYHHDYNGVSMKSMRAFTLAEVLVTLGIIGVVSAMTVPSLMQNYQRQSYVTQLHKVYNEIQQAAVSQMNSKNAINLIEAGINSQTAANNFIKDNFKNIKSIEKIETKVETIKDSYRKHILEEVERFLSDEERVCPICGLENKRNIKEIIKEELLKISDIKELVVKKYQEINPDLKSDEILEKVNSIVEFVKENEIETNHIINYLLCGGSKEKADLIIKNIDLIKNINNEIEELELRKEQFYNNLKNKKDSLANTFKFQFDVKSKHLLFLHTDSL